MTQHSTVPADRTETTTPTLPPELGNIVRRGDRVLAVGPGPLAIALADRTACQVISVHATLADVEAVRAPLGPRGRAAATVDAQVDDLAAGRPEHGPYNVIVVTAGISGLSPQWVRQLTPRGVIVAPLALGGLHPWTVAGRDRYDHLWYGQVLGVDPVGTGPQPATGPLNPGIRPGPDNHGELPAPRLAAEWAGALPPRLTRTEYLSLWLWLASHDDRITTAEAADTGEGPGAALVDGSSAVHITPHGLWLTDTEPSTMALAQHVADRIARWGQRCPHLTQLTCRLASPSGAGPDALLAPGNWSTDRVATLPR
ncbi:hypothetical protein ACIOJE_35215 [Kitasatospora sp. NPDC087861]|uniref:hypothetical protein n=1 Tax=Kitasatospora sp. NPDC087861 TaxID=3364070 RepID=UPI003820C3A9